MKVPVTLLADASHCPRTRAAGWAAWGKREGEAALTWSGPLTGAFSSAGDAELAALAHALQEASAAGWLDVGDGVLLQSDCLRALGLLLTFVLGARERVSVGGLAVSATGPLLPTPVERHYIAAVQAVVAKTGCRIVVRHVKGHRRESGLSWVNRRCDALARRAMQKARASTLGLTPTPPAAASVEVRA